MLSKSAHQLIQLTHEQPYEYINTQGQKIVYMPNILVCAFLTQTSPTFSSLALMTLSLAACTCCIFHTSGGNIVVNRSVGIHDAVPLYHMRIRMPVNACTYGNVDLLYFTWRARQLWSAVLFGSILLAILPLLKLWLFAACTQRSCLYEQTIYSANINSIYTSSRVFFISFIGEDDWLITVCPNKKTA